jgi:hypothetical protein
VVQLLGSKPGGQLRAIQELSETAKTKKRVRVKKKEKTWRKKIKESQPSELLQDIVRSMRERKTPPMSQIGEEESFFSFNKRKTKH